MLSNLQLTFWGNIASVFGLLITIGGFGITLYRIYKVHKIARQTRQEIRRADISVELELVSNLFNELRFLQRKKEKNWELIQDRYSAIRKKLIVIKERHPDLEDDDKQLLQSGIQHISNIEKVLEKGFENTKFPSSSKLNESIIEISTRITELFAKLYH